MLVVWERELPEEECGGDGAEEEGGEGGPGPNKCDFSCFSSVAGREGGQAPFSFVVSLVFHFV